MKSIAFIYSGKQGELPSLEPDRKEVERVLTTFGDWESENITNKELDTLEQFKKDLAIHKDCEIENLLFYFTGHGTREGIEKKELYLNIVKEEPRNMNEFLTAIYTILELKKPKRIAIILDTCFSGTFINSHEHISDSFEVLTSSVPLKTSLGVVESSELSLFTGEFCKAIEVLSYANKEITLDTIYTEIKDKLGSYTCMPSAPFLTEGRIKIANKLLSNKQAELKQESQIFVNYINANNISKDDLLNICEEFLEKDLVDIFRAYKNIDDIVSHLFTNQKFSCVMKKLYVNYNQDIVDWLEEQDIRLCKELNQEEKNARVLIIFNSQHDGKKYDVSFASKDVLSIKNGQNNKVYDLADEESKSELKEKMMSYAKYNPQVDLILPIELMKEDVNLWEAGFCESLSRLSQLNLRYIERYNSDDEFKEIYKEQWTDIIVKMNNNQTLYPVNNESDLREVGNNMNECGLSSPMLLEEKHFKFVFKTNMSYIMLWLTGESDAELSDLLKDGIDNLQNNYYKNTDKPINLMWDDPTKYYYP